MRRFLTWVAIPLLLVACGKSNKVKYDLKFELKEGTQLSAGLQALYEKLQAGEEVEWDEITRLQIEQHRANLEARTGQKGSELQSKVEELAKVQSEAALSWEYKTSYEKQIESNHGAATVYNFEHVSLGDFVLLNKMQCYSGSMLHEVIGRLKFDASAYRAMNWVLIMETGHILPGYLIQGQNGFELTGIETTATGRAKINYGPVNQIQSQFRIVDAELFAIIELFKFHLKDPEAVANEVLNRTAQRYGLQSPYLVETARMSADTLNTGPFFFGNKDVPPGDLKRTEIDSRDRKDIPDNNPSPYTDANRGSYIPSTPVPNGSVRDQIEAVLKENLNVQGNGVSLSGDSALCQAITANNVPEELRYGRLAAACGNGFPFPGTGTDYWNELFLYSAIDTLPPSVLPDLLVLFKETIFNGQPN